MDGNHMKETAADLEVRDRAEVNAAKELRQFVERIEMLEAEKKQVSLEQASVFAEAKGRGYNAKAMHHVIKLRKLRPDELAEQEAVITLYRIALGF